VATQLSVAVHAAVSRSSPLYWKHCVSVSVLDPSRMEVCETGLPSRP
jgi:hypothetical protein